MNTDKQEKYHLDYFVKACELHNKKHIPFGTSSVQRLCRIGYNNACYVIQRGINEGIFKKCADNEFQYEFTNPTGINE